jgi:ABC-type glutathione transport system ATPase component
MTDHPATTSPLLDIRDVVVTFGPGARRAVDGVSLQLEAGRTLGLVGESGSGKSTLSRVVMGLLRPASGRVLIDGLDVHASRGAAMRSIRRRAQMIFQDPAGSLNPRLRVRDIVAEPLVVHGLAWKDRVGELLEECGMPASSMDRFPHEFSGGQRQRIAIARALALRPALVICDEPTSALDVSVQAQILNLLQDLQRSRGMAYLFITHDLGVVSHMADRVAVMREGRIVEEGDASRMLRSPAHEYTRTLLGS